VGLLYYRNSCGNFGDDLNEMIWRHLLPADVLDNGEILLVGIGSIFNHTVAAPSVTAGKRVFVIGSGAGYGPLPSGWREWTILAVRGPLTAPLIKRPELSITDAAALIANVQESRQPNRARNDIIFMPHYHSAERGRWSEVASKAGMIFVDPRWSVTIILKMFQQARLVMTEAMHGAIVADALRIPWIPLQACSEALSFKWQDWTLSVGLPYTPLKLPSSSAWESLCNRRVAGDRHANPKGSIASIEPNADEMEAIIQAFHRRYSTPASPPMDSVTGRSFSPGLRRAVRGVIENIDRLSSERAAEYLGRASRTTPYLSEDGIFNDRLDRLSDCVSRFISAV